MLPWVRAVSAVTFTAGGSPKLELVSCCCALATLKSVGGNRAGLCGVCEKVEEPWPNLLRACTLLVCYHTLASL